MHTEEQAKELWCPHFRFSGNKEITHTVWNTCIGSKCAQWRWTDTFKDNGSPILDGTGYCGLAGKP